MLEPQARLGLADTLGEIARYRGQRLLPRCAQILYHRSLRCRLQAAREHPGYSHRHVAQGLQPGDQAAKPDRGVAIGCLAQNSDEFDQHCDRLQEAFGTAPFVRELTGGLPPRHVALPKQMVARHEGIVQHDLVEVMVATWITNGIDRYALRREVDQELGETVAPVLPGGGGGSKDADHVVCEVGRAGPHLAAREAPTVAVRDGLRGRGEEIAARARFAHADGKRAFAGAYPRQDVPLDVFGRVLEQHRTALPVGGEVGCQRSAGEQKLLVDDETLKMAPLVSAIDPGPSHADPALGSESTAEIAIEPHGPALGRRCKQTVLARFVEKTAHVGA